MLGLEICYASRASSRYDQVISNGQCLDNRGSKSDPVNMRTYRGKK
jgi:hypothetical protein